MSHVQSPVNAPAVTTWRVDPAHTNAGFAVRHLMISTVRGRFSEVDGTVDVAGDDFGTAKVRVSIGTASVDTREPKRDEHLRSADFFDAGRFPTIDFVSRQIEKAGEGRYAVTGALTIRGVTRDVTLDVAAEGQVRDPWGGLRAGFSAKGVINRTDFGLTWNAALETGGVLVGEEVKLSIDLELVQQATSSAAA